jgi:GNAT superfamily N-acetyltransferase
MQTLLQTKSESANLYYCHAEKNDIQKLQTICDSWTDKLLVEGKPFPADYIANCIDNGDLPPIENAKFENYSFNTICRKSDNEAIGFFDMYHGYPTSDTLWISMFVIDQSFQKAGYGSEMVDLLSFEAKQSGFSTLGIGVHLKNKKALLFWVKNRFDEIFEFNGDKKLDVDTFPVVKLKKML